VDEDNTGKDVELLAKRENADLFLYNGPIQSQRVDRLRHLVCQRAQKRDNVILFLTTYGGDPDSAFRLAACLRRNYKKFAVYVFGFCKSAGTLAALGADRVVIGNFGELGPLDVQLTKPDELIPTSSGLDIFQAMGVLTNSAFEAFERYMINIVATSDGHISAKTAAEIARELAVGLFAPMTGQIEPERLGEVQRAINIANVYGERLNHGRTNLKKGALERLVQGYPTHGFVIDIDEAKSLFNDVREADPLEQKVAGFFALRRPVSEPIVLDIVETYVRAGGSNASGARRKKGRGRPTPAGSKRQANVTQLRPDVGGDTASAERNAHTGGSSAIKKLPAKRPPPRAAVAE
jgi:Serine dehydrogenase proteinase